MREDWLRWPGWLAGWLTAWLIGWLIGWLVAWLRGSWLIGLLADWLPGWLVGWLNSWLIGWLAGWLTGCLIGRGCIARTSPNQNFDRDSGALRARVPTKTVEGTRARPSSEGPCACSDCGGQTLALIRGAIGRSINSVHVSPFGSPVAKTVKRYC